MKQQIRIFLLVLGLILTFFVGLFLWLQSAVGQDYLTQKTAKYLSQKIKSKVTIGKIRFDLPNWFLLEDIYIQDLQKDTLLQVKKAYFTLDAKKIWNKNIYLKQIKLDGLHTEIYKFSEKDDFNYQFILNAFTSNDTSSQQNSSNSIAFDLKEISLKNASIRYSDNEEGILFQGKMRNFFVQLNKFDINRGIYDINQVLTDHSHILFKQNNVGFAATQNMPKAAFPSINLKKIVLSHISWDVETPSQGFQSRGSLQNFLMNLNKMDLNQHFVDIEQIRGDKIDGTVLIKNTPSKAMSNRSQNSDKPWNLALNRFKIANTTFGFRNISENQAINGFNPNHIQLNKVEIDISKIKIGKKNQARINQFSFSERSGLVVKKLNTAINLSNNTLHLNKLTLQTNYSELTNDLQITFSPNTEIGNTRVKALLTKNKIGVKDMLVLYPALAENPLFHGKKDTFVSIEGNIFGKINDLFVDNLSIAGLGNTHLKMSGSIKGLPTIEHTKLNVSLQQMIFYPKDYVFLLGDSLLKAYDFPEKVIVEGNISGKPENLALDVRLLSDLGGFNLLGSLRNFDKNTDQQYEVEVALDSFDLGKLLRQKSNLGFISANFNINGAGLTFPSMKAVVQSSIHQLNIAGNNLEKIQFNANLNRENIQFDVDFRDKAIRGNVFGVANTAIPNVEFHSNFEEINFNKINLIQQNLSYGGKIDANINLYNRNNPVAKITFLNTKIQKDGRTVEADKGILEIKDNLQEKEISFKSSILNASMKGEVEYQEIQDVFLRELNKYFVISDLPTKVSEKPYRLNLELQLIPHPFYSIFSPNLKSFKPIDLHLDIDSKKDSSLQASLQIPYLNLDSTIIEHGNFIVNTNSKIATYSGNIEKVQSLAGDFFENQLFGEIRNNQLSFALKSKDSVAQTRFSFAGNLQKSLNNYQIRFSPEAQLLDYQAWQADSNGSVYINSKGLYAKNITFAQNIQKIQINSTTDTSNAPLHIEVSNVDIQPIGKLVSQDSSLVGGILDGDIQLSNWDEAAQFTGKLSIKDFEFTKIPIGNLAIHAFNPTKEFVEIDASIKSKNNDIKLQGDYRLNSDNPLNLKLIINKLGAETIEAFSLGQLKKASGNLAGNLHISGSNTSPSISGNIKFDTVRFNSAQLGARYLIQNQSFDLVKSKLIFDKFNIIDSLGQDLRLKGYISLQKLPDFDYQLNLDTRNFMFLNGSRKDNGYFYGKGFADAQLLIKGINTKPSIEGNIKIKGSSDITFLMPDREIEKAETEGIVEFINKKTITPIDTLTKNNLDFAEEISLNIEVDNQSQLTIVVDELNGDNLKVKGKAQLNTGITSSGQSYILGLYELNSGSYDVSFQLLRKQFSIEKGSTLLWTGDPMQAQIDIKAIYRLNSEVPKADKSKSFTKTPLEVVLKMSGNLSNPSIDFEIRVDENAPKDLAEAIKNDGYLSDLKQNPVEMNKQVFSLLVLNSFMSEQSNDFFSSINPEAIARQSVSKLLSDQLNFLAGDIIKGVKLNFDLNSTVGNSETGASAKTDLNIGLSKAFMNNRLKVAVGRNFQLENTQGNAISNELIDNLSLNYNLSKDGRYQFSAYRKNQYQAILDGFVVETGMAFSITLDYELFKELFQKVNEIQ